MATVKHERKCIVCGEAYSYCPRCSEDLSRPAWYGIFCSDNCHDIYDITLRYGEGLLTKAEAKSALSKMDVRKKDEFHPVIKMRLNEIMGIKESKKEEFVD
jgi:hypothetical protein